MNKILIMELAEMGVAVFIMVICAVMMFTGIDSEVKAVFIMGATLAVRAGFNIVRNGVNNDKRN